MIQHRLFVATTLVATAALIACSSPTSSTAPAVSANSSSASASSVAEARSGVLHLVKNCDQYTGMAGSYCTISSSNLKAIDVGSRVVYAAGVVFPTLNSAIMLDPPAPGNNQAFGHVTLDLATRQGVVTITGGNGRFKGLRGEFAVTNVGGNNWAWDGPYNYTDNGSD
jgi:hypothetical protein